MKAHLLKGSIYREVEIISNTIRDVNGRFIPNTINTYNGEHDFDNEVTYVVSQPRDYGKNTTILELVKLVDHNPKKYRFLGDLTMFKTHSIAEPEAAKFIYDNFGIDPERKLTVAPKNSKREIEYICSDDIIKNKFSPKQLPQSKNAEWEKIPEPLWKKPRRSDFHSRSIDRAFCLGCAMNKPLNNKIFMTAIDCSNNMIVILAVDMELAKEIKNNYIKNNQDKKYDKIEKWMYNNDLILSFENKYKVVSKPTIYNDLSGDINLFSHKACLISTMHSQANTYNGYVGDLYHDKIDSFQNANKLSINLDTREAIFLDVSGDKIYTKYSLPNPSTDDEDFDFLELS